LTLPSPPNSNPATDGHHRCLDGHGRRSAEQIAAEQMLVFGPALGPAVDRHQRERQGVAQIGGSSQARSAAWNAATSSPFSTWWNVLEQSRTYAVHGSPGGTTLLEASRKLAPYNRVVRPFRFGVNVWTAASRAAWQDKARRLEALG